MSSRSSIRLFQSARLQQSVLVWCSILLLALSHGVLYASVLPPWGLVDEEHHVHYIQHVAEHRATPVVGQTYLSSEIVESLFMTRRWEFFHWPTPSSDDPQEMGLEGHSYEGYQPPLFYILLAPLYMVLPDDVLTKLYCLRWVMVGLSLLTVWMSFRIVSELFPRHYALPYVVGLLLAVLPERIASVSRVNNDVLLEVVATACVWVFTRMALKGLSVRHSQLLGLLFGLGILTKTSMAVLLVLLLCLLWMNRHTSNWLPCALWMSGTATALIVPLVVRNLWLYGDLTGFTGFKALNRTFVVLPSPDITWQSLFQAVRDLFRHFWVVWWKGSLATSNPVLNGFHIALVVLSCLSLARTICYVQGQCRHRLGKCSGKTPIVPTGQILVVYLLAILGCAGGVLISYFAGNVPVIQGRFFLPVIAPVVILFSWGLWYGVHRKALVLATLVVLILVDALSLFGNLLPYFYYWSAFVKSGVPQPYTSLGWRAAWALFYPRFLSDKPVAIQAMLPWILLWYVMSLIFAGAMFMRVLVSSHSRPSAIDDHMGL